MQITHLLRNTISDSAYMVNISRNKSLRISQDKYSHLWIPDSQKKEVKTLWNLYSKEVYPYDDLELGIRTKYFLKQLNNAIDKYDDLIFINIASGFTSYQYLVDKPIETIELDYKDIINTKKSRANKLIKNDILPNRLTHYLSCNLNSTRSRKRAFQKINQIVHNRNTIVFCEGLFYYLKNSIIEKIITNISIVQNPNNKIVFDFWDKNLKKHKIYKGMITFYKEKMGLNKNEINLFHPNEINSIKDYNTIEITNVFEQEILLTKSTILNEKHVICLKENYANLQLKKASSKHCI